VSIAHEICERANVIGLSGIAGDSIDAAESASQATVNDHQPFAGPVVHSLRPHQAEAVRCAIPGLEVDMLRPQAHRTMIAVTAVGQRCDRCAAVVADEALILGTPADGSASRLKK
jgi:hypothetical protein